MTPSNAIIDLADDPPEVINGWTPEMFEELARRLDYTPEERQAFEDKQRRMEEAFERMAAATLEKQQRLGAQWWSDNIERPRATRRIETARRMAPAPPPPTRLTRSARPRAKRVARTSAPTRGSPGDDDPHEQTALELPLDPVALAELISPERGSRYREAGLDGLQIAAAEEAVRRVKTRLLPKGGAMTTELTDVGSSLHQVENFVRRYVVLSDDQATAVALWVGHSHAFTAANATPYLSISSAEMESGKTRLLEVLRLLVANPWFTGRTTAAALTRKIDKSAPTLLLDEFDATTNGDKEFAEVLRGVLNSGYREGGAVTVCVGQGANLDVKDFSSFCPKAIAGLGNLPDTVRSRSIPIVLKRRLASESIERFRERKARPMGETIADWLENHIEKIREDLAGAEPDLPEELSDRQMDVWEPLFAIADASGGDWPDRARAAAVRLSSRGEPDEGTLGIRLLADVREAFNGNDRLRTTDLLTALHEMEDGPWADWYGKPLAAPKLGRFLKAFQIKRRTIWLGDGRSAKGFLREQFEDAWARYLPQEGGSKRSGGQDGSDKPKTGTPKRSGTPAPDRFGNPEKPHEQANLTGLTATDPGYGGNGASATPEELHGCTVAQTPPPDPEPKLEDAVLDPAMAADIAASVGGEWVDPSEPLPPDAIVLDYLERVRA